jgi:DNA-binding winged helix-turn-helix (wHTH) protein
LQYLIENAGKVVTKDELLGRVWNGSFVEESNLPVHISKLRRLLGESLDRRFIETVQGTVVVPVCRNLLNPPLRVNGKLLWQ